MLLTDACRLINKEKSWLSLPSRALSRAHSENALLVPQHADSHLTLYPLMLRGFYTFRIAIRGCPGKPYLGRLQHSRSNVAVHLVVMGIFHYGGMGLMACMYATRA